MVVLVYFWKINLRSLPFAILHMALDRLTLGRNKKITFFKSLGTGKGETFTPNDADAKRWGLLVVIDSNEVNSFDSSRLISRWRKIAISEYRATLQPISSHGMWSRREPFSQNQISDWKGPIAAITRARIKWSMNSKFWGAVPPVTVSLNLHLDCSVQLELVKHRLAFRAHFQDGNLVRHFAPLHTKDKHTLQQSKRLKI